MARPKSENKRDAIVAAAIEVIAAQGLSAPTATIANEAGIANGSLFIYFPTKTDLLNAVYVALKVEMSAAALDGLNVEQDVRQQLFLTWSNWLRWAATFPKKRRALALLGVSHEISPQSRAAGYQAMAGAMEVLERCRSDGPMRDSEIGFVASLVNALAEATIDFLVIDPKNADQHRIAGFEAMWRMLA
ncbi:TetR/AcrR family transcriptional regulator [Labrys monachus]|uniref:AcrR family transcriptional regulator n=1 Tax=Labrys monachus TaxID=217067 RepID=A0ABU0FB55_9HYPH|nr:TetR/AcrR family transcriptional regulator [Labrys monachus]MDQ0391275.1 AcrR family transcriptional regulator [Labrys monachus]